MRYALIILSLMFTSIVQAVNMDDVVNLARIYSPALFEFRYDNIYHTLTAEKLNYIITDHRKKIKKYKFIASINPYANTYYDCDDYATTFKAAVSDRSLIDGKNYACGIIIVYQRNDFGGIKGSETETHALNLIVLSNVPFVIEPQSYHMVPLYDYINKHEIYFLMM
jgi:hypothetical protein